MKNSQVKKDYEPIARALKVSKKEARDFYNEVCRRLNPLPSIDTIAYWAGKYGKLNPTVMGFVDFILKNELTIERRDPLEKSITIEIKPPSHRIAKGYTKKQLEWERKMATARHLRPTIMPKAPEQHVNETLKKQVAALLPKEQKNDMDAARLFLLDMKTIHPEYIYEKEIFLAAVKRCARRNKVTVDEVWETMWKIRNPGADRIQVISTPMGGKK